MHKVTESKFRLSQELERKVAMSRTTGQVCIVSGVYRAVGNCGHSVERVIPEGQVFPPCEYCREQGKRKDITWVLVTETQAK